MEARMKKYRQVSPERTKVWTSRSPKYRQQNQMVSVVYYLCRNRQLEHPHFIEVPLSSPDGLYLRDVIERLNVLRGRGIASMYSWSSKRSYKNINGFVWHDLSEDDLILPAHGNEYVLKGSELFEESSSDHFSTGNIKFQNLKQSPEPVCSSSRDDSSSSSSLNGKETKHSQDDELSPPMQHRGSSGVSPEFSFGKNLPWNGSLSLTEYKIYKSDGSADASTQTEENVGRTHTRETCMRGVSTDDNSLESECNENYQNRVPYGKENSEFAGDSVSPPPSSSSASSSGGKTETLESLIRADASKINSFRILEEEDIRMPTNGRLKTTNMLMQLISCGSISVKDHRFGIIPTYRPAFSHSKFSSPLFPTSMFGKEEGGGASTSGSSKCIPQTIKTSITKQPSSESMRSPISDKPRNSSEVVDGSQPISSRSCDGGSKRMMEPGKSKRQDSSIIKKEKVIKIEERLASGARVIIQSKAP